MDTNERAIESLSQKLSQLIERSAQEAQEQQAQKVRDVMADVLTRSYDKAMAYTNILLIAGYAGGFTLWNFSRPIMSKRCIAIIAALLTVSLSTFIFFEVGKMIQFALLSLNQRAILVRQLPATDLLREMQKVGKAADWSMMKILMPIWYAMLGIAVPTALAAIALLLYSCGAVIFGFPRWP